MPDYQSSHIISYHTEFINNNIITENIREHYDWSQIYMMKIDLNILGDISFLYESNAIIVFAN